MIADITATADGANTGAKENVEPFRFTPVTATLFTVLFATAILGLMDVIAGVGTTTKLLVETAVLPETVTESGAVIAVVGTCTSSSVAVAASTVAAMAPNRMVFADGVVLKACPWIRTVVKTPPLCGVKLKILSSPGVGSVERFTSSVLPTES